MNKKQKLYLTFSLLLTTTVASSVATFTYLNVKVKPGIELITNKNKAHAYDEKVDLSTKLIRIPKSHILEYVWFSKTSQDTEFKQINKNQNTSSLTTWNQDIDEVQYYVQVNDLTTNKTYKSSHISIKYTMPELYLSAKTQNNKIINPYLETIKDDRIRIVANFDSSVSSLESEEGWYIYKKDIERELKSIKKLLESNNSSDEYNFVNNNNFIINGREIEIANLNTLKDKLGQEYIIRYFWTDVMGKDLYQDLQLKFD